MKEINIFYADDDDDDLMFFEEAVASVSNSAKKFIKLHLHRNGENLVDAIKKNKFINTVVFLDLNMPLKSGFEILEEIRSKPETKLTPVIIYSTSSDEKNITMSQNLGANFYAVKPYDFNDLLKMILNVIQINWENHTRDVNNFLFNKLSS